jgi:hypothetical protein
MGKRTVEATAGVSGRMSADMRGEPKVDLKAFQKDPMKG